MGSECNAGKGEALTEWFHSLWLFLLWWGPCCDCCRYSGTGLWVRGFWPPLMWSTPISPWLNSLTWYLEASVFQGWGFQNLWSLSGSGPGFLLCSTALNSAQWLWEVGWAEQGWLHPSVCIMPRSCGQLCSPGLMPITHRPFQHPLLWASLGMLSLGQLPPSSRCIPGKLRVRGIF